MNKKIDSFRSPGHALKIFLDKKQWTQEDLSHILSFSLKHTNELIKNKRSISIQTAELLASIFDGLSVKDWVILDLKYRLSNQQEDLSKTEIVKRKTGIFQRMPVNELIKKGWLKTYKDIVGLEKQVASFWGIDYRNGLDLSFLDNKVEKIYHRTSEAYKSEFNYYNTLVWHQMASSFANKIKAPDFDKVALSALMEEMHSYTISHNGISKFLNELNKAGVKFVFLSHLSKTYLDGAAFISNGSPVVCLTGRYDRVDNFWFTLAHELIHVSAHLIDKNSDTIFADDTVNRNQNHSEKENEANDGAGRILLNDQILDFFEDYIGYIIEGNVLEFSCEHQIHPSIVVGILAFNEKVSYSTLHRFKEPVRDKIPLKYYVGK